MTAGTAAFAAREGEFLHPYARRARGCQEKYMCLPSLNLEAAQAYPEAISRVLGHVRTNKAARRLAVIAKHRIRHAMDVLLLDRLLAAAAVAAVVDEASPVEWLEGLIADVSSQIEHAVAEHGRVALLSKGGRP